VLRYICTNSSTSAQRREIANFLFPEKKKMGDALFTHFEIQIHNTDSKKIILL
jgi:hypothetical protein